MQMLSPLSSFSSSSSSSSRPMMMIWFSFATAAWLLLFSSSLEVPSTMAFPLFVVTTTTTTKAKKKTKTIQQQLQSVHKNLETAEVSWKTLAEEIRGDFEILERTWDEEEVQDDNDDDDDDHHHQGGDNNSKKTKEKKKKTKPLIYLDSAATSQKPKLVLQAMDEFYKTSNANVHRGAHTLSREATTAYEAARDTVAQFINAPHRNEIIFTSGATEALNLIVQTYARATLLPSTSSTSQSQPQPQQEVILTMAEHHANIVPWQILQAEIPFTIHFAKLDPQTGRLDLEHFQSLLNENTAIVSFQHASNVLGYCNPVQEMVQMVRRQQQQAQANNTNTPSPPIAIILDACQSVPHMTVNVQELGVDFLVASGHKMCGPTGIGFLWGRLPLLNSMPPYQGGGEMIDTVTTVKSTFLPSPMRFEAGTPPIAQAIGLAAAIQYLQSQKVGGMKRIELYERFLAQYLYQQLSQVPGITILGPPSPSSDDNDDHNDHSKFRTALCAFVHETIHASDLSQFLDLYGVAVRAGHHCCQPLHYEALGISHSIRASLAFYNTPQEIDMFIHYLKETIAFFESVQGGTTITTEKDGSIAAADVSSSSSDDFVPFI